ncbi:MAG: YkgJ family cysteine cluster protein [Spirochaetia bacterium]|jgi:Fe-S-cluster containining protein|nr:YkgJ family cysteine cluster protein [Spirochaetia bacterium]
MVHFYDKGLCFACRGCHYCCSTEPGFVFLNQGDVDAACAYLKLDEASFIASYCRKVPQGEGWYKISLIEKKNFDCIFLTKEGCGIYPARPLQCRTYPFWPSIMENQHSWEEETRYCPGVGKGTLRSGEEIRHLLKLQEENVPLLKRC